MSNIEVIGKIKIAGEELRITPNENRHYHEVEGTETPRIIPKRARIYLEPSKPGWGGYPGITQFVRQSPPDKYLRVKKTLPEKIWVDDHGVLGYDARIYDEGHDKACFPEELPKMLKFAEEVLRWNIDPAVQRALLDAMARE